jgi:hypothetical protein
MHEYVETEVWNAIYARARQCECENPKCKHAANHCSNALDAKARISLPEGVRTVQEKIDKGRALCEECFQRSDSFYRQQPIVS